MRLSPLAVLLAGVPQAFAQGERPEFPDPPHQVLLLGTFHFQDAGLDEYKPEVDVNILSEERQGELQEVLAVLERFQPTHVAVEQLASRQATLDARYEQFLNDEVDLPANEVYQLGFRLARRLGHDGVHAIDAKRRHYEPFVDPDDYAATHGQETLVNSPWYGHYLAAAEWEDRSKAHLSLGEILLNLNDPERIRLSHGVYMVGSFRVGLGDEYPGADGKTSWYNRNLRIFANILRLTEPSVTPADGGQRILVIIGAGHLPILRHCVETSPEVQLVEVASLMEAPRTPVPAVDAAELVRSHTYDLEHGEALGGPGLEFLLRETAEAQFVLIGEPHNVDQVNRFTGQLFAALGPAHGFRYLVTEQDGAIMDRLTAEGVRGDLEAVRERARRYPDAFHFDTDEELALLAKVGRLSDAEQPLWGVDRVHDAGLGLEVLLEEASSDVDSARIAPVIEAARNHAASGTDQPFMTGDHPGFRTLLRDLAFEPGTRGAEMLHALRVSREDWLAWQADRAPGEPWGLQANARREQLMKSRFLARYRWAVAGGEAEPRAIAKMGQWHIRRGSNPGNTPTLGSFLVEVARFHDRQALSINIQPVNRLGRHWSITDYDDYDLFREVADPDRWRLVDLRPLRGYVHSRALRVPADLRTMIFGFDLLLLLGGTDPGRATWQEER